jgi:hypothetical protein
LSAFLPAGADAGRWKRWQSEVQMLLFEHAVNHRREREGLAPVNSVWLWGGGRYEPTDSSEANSAAIFADDARVRALARGAGLDIAPVPAGFSALPRTPSAAVWLEPIDTGATSARLAAIDSIWMAPVARALGTGSLRAVELVLGGHDRALRFAVGRISLARRLRARLAPPRLSQLLAAFASVG